MLNIPTCHRAFSSWTAASRTLEKYPHRLIKKQRKEGLLPFPTKTAHVRPSNPFTPPFPRVPLPDLNSILVYHPKSITLTEYPRLTSILSPASPLSNNFPVGLDPHASTTPTVPFPVIDPLSSGTSPSSGPANPTVPVSVAARTPMPTATASSASAALFARKHAGTDAGVRLASSADPSTRAEQTLAKAKAEAVFLSHLTQLSRQATADRLNKYAERQVGIALSIQAEKDQLAAQYPLAFRKHLALQEKPSVLQRSVYKFNKEQAKSAAANLRSELTKAELDELRSLRKADSVKWSANALAEKFNIPVALVGKLAPSKRDRRVTGVNTSRVPVVLKGISPVGQFVNWQSQRTAQKRLAIRIPAHSTVKSLVAVVQSGRDFLGIKRSSLQSWDDIANLAVSVSGVGKTSEILKAIDEEKQRLGDIFSPPTPRVESSDK